MAIVTFTPPSGVYLSRNAIPLKVGIIDDVNQYPTYCMASASEPDPDILQWRLRWMHKGIVYTEGFYFVSEPDDSGTQLPIPDPWVSGYALGIISSAFENHPVIGPFFSAFEMPVTGAAFIIAAKVWGVQIIQIVDFLGSDRLTISPSQIKEESYTLTRSSVLARFFIENVPDSETYSLIVETMYSSRELTNNSLPPQLNTDSFSSEAEGMFFFTLTAERFLEGELYIDIHHFFESYVRHTPFSLGYGMFEVRHEMNKRCRIDVWEYYDGKKQGEGESSAPFRVIHGGLNKVELSKYFVYETGNAFRQNWAVVLKRYLTYRPNVREVTMSMKHNLYWLVGVLRGSIGETPENYILKVRKYYTDGTSAVSTISNDSGSGIIRGSTAVIQAGVSELDLDDPFSPLVLRAYDLWIERQSNAAVIGQLVRFNIRPAHYLHRYVYWRNSFGYYECTLFEGESKLLVEVEKKMTETMHQSQPGIMSPDSRPDQFISSVASELKGTTSMTLETGAMSAEELAAHADMLRNDFVMITIGSPADFWGSVPARLRSGAFEMGYRNQNGEHINGLRITVDFEDTVNNTLHHRWYSQE